MSALPFLMARGVAVTSGPVAMGPGRQAEIRDLDDVPIETWQWSVGGK